LRRLVVLAAAGLLASTALAQLAATLWVADLIVNFRPQLLALAAAVAIVALFVRRWTAFAACAAVVLWNALAVGALPAEAPPAATAAQLRVGLLNVWILNGDTYKVAEWIRRESPDVLVLIEIDDQWRGALAGAVADYPNSSYVRGKGRSGIWMLSRAPRTIFEEYAFRNARHSNALIATVEAGDRNLRIVSLHGAWPLRRDGWRARNEAFDELASYMRASPGATLLVGDLNCTPFSPHFTELLRAGRLRSAAAPRLWWPTWPAFFVPLGLQIDHALLSPELALRSLRKTAGLGSDHEALMIELAWPNATSVVAMRPEMP
jgi:endonuclease/exonuclease/phosphatase (EEP) superfamily protein YafD